MKRNWFHIYFIFHFKVVSLIWHFGYFKFENRYKTNNKTNNNNNNNNQGVERVRQKQNQNQNKNKNKRKSNTINSNNWTKN